MTMYTTVHTNKTETVQKTPNLKRCVSGCKIEHSDPRLGSCLTPYPARWSHPGAVGTLLPRCYSRHNSSNIWTHLKCCPTGKMLQIPRLQRAPRQRAGTTVRSSRLPFQPQYRYPHSAVHCGATLKHTFISDWKYDRPFQHLLYV